MCRCDPRSAFHWQTNTEPTVFALDSSFTARSNGLTQSQITTRAVEKFEATHGRSLGSVHLMSKAGDDAIEQRQSQRRAMRTRQG